ncbi:uncharacterized protein STEHIDRAFT_166597 [Stereum hirsutum FP-91666 SS1]|uniref:uncharacterized protein n=1 Tax=Stereum hirsutum (strain FP-91666) TaxID=721885 RepID=UPI000440CB19|nr:uncharacterized protein STEHIDRAFT_166597 [Stereum hirsutum FP-91666 SS1]EIM90409.1 hypothetical protein STEHIDRAFT_166597 [Stereum hirsutum FP-91666 SS1]
MQQTRSMISLLAFLAAILMTTTCVDAANLPTRQTNADRLRRNLGPMAPVKRVPTPALAARQAAASAGTTQGRAAITLADGTVLGHLSADDPSQVNADSTTTKRRRAASSDVVLKFVEGAANGSLLAQNANYSPPYIGQTDADLTGSIPFTNVAEGDLSTIWTLNSTSGTLSAQWTNPDGSKPSTYILYHKAKTQLTFSNTDTVEGAEAVTLSLSV